MRSYPAAVPSLRRSAVAVVVATVALSVPGASAQPPVGFPNVPQTAGQVLSGLNAPQQGRTALLAYHNGLLFTVPEVPSSQPGADFLVRTWDMRDPTAPVEIHDFGVTPMPINAHGYFKGGDYLVLGSNWPPEAPWSFQASLGPNPADWVTRTTFPGLLCAGVRGCLFQPWFVGDTYWSYGEIEGDAFISFDGSQLASWDHLGQTGVIGHPFLLGDLLIFASDQSRTGVATYDVSDPTNPVLLDVLTTGGPGGYWPELWGGDGHLYVVFPYRTGGNGFRVVDASDPSDLRFVADVPLPGAASMYAQFQDEYGFMGDHKVDMRTFESVLFLDGANVVRPDGTGVGIDTSQFALPLGNLLVTGGIGPNEGMAIWAHQDAPDTRGPSVGYHVPQAGRTGYPTGAPISLLIHETLETSTLVNGTTFTVRPLGGSPIPGRLIFSFDDVLTFTPDAPLLPDTTYEVVLPAGGIRDAAGNGMVGYSFTFSTGGSVAGNGAPDIDSLTASSYPVSPGASVTLTASATDPESDPVEYRFDFGDGSPKTEWSSSPSVATNYPDPGHYRATVQARDPSGALASRTLTVTVLDPPAGPPPTRSSSLACDAAGRRAWAVNPDNDTVTAVHLDALTADFEVPACDDPRSVAVTGSGELWVACHDDDRVRVLAGDGSPLASLDLGYGSAPAGIAVSPDGATAYVTLQGSGELVRFATATRQETGRLFLGPRPRAVAVTPDGSRVLVTRLLSPPDHAEIWDVNAAGMTLAGTLEIAKFGGDENRDGTASGRGTANYLTGIAVAPDGASAWVVANKPNVQRGLLFGPDLDSDNTVRNLVFQIDLATGELERAIDLDNSDSASAVAFSPLGDYLLVTLQGNDETLVLDALAVASANGLGSLVTRIAGGAAPQGICTDPVTGRTLVKNLMGRDVTVLETDPLFRFGTVAIATSSVETVGAETLPPPILSGKRVFYFGGDPRMSAEGYLSCASCHLDGGHDGRTWDFTGRGEGLRNTASLRGRAGMGHGNVHWTANFDEIQDFENDIRFGFGGSGFLSDPDFQATEAPLGPPKAGLSADLDALAGYVASLGADRLPRSPHRDPDGSLTAQAITGRGVFDALGCASCHAGASFTDSELGPSPLLHDVGTIRTTSGQRLGQPLTGLDTPTLLGLWNTAPYLHDGSAATVDEVFRLAGGEVIPAEDGSVAGGASVVDQFVDLNNDDTVHGRAYVALDSPGESMTLSGVDGGAGGTGAIELRYSTRQGGGAVEISVNGGPAQTLALPDVGNDPSWRHTNWARARLEGVTLAAGAANSITVATSDPFPNHSIDELTVTTADHLATAGPHRTALALSPADRDALVAYLLQLDGTADAGVGIFSDGFESGDVAAWSAAVP